ncbi:MAG: DUF4783 domain-containing protein [Chitinophagia bacterium]|nr:DUF4783 domain-containing protein [Chitinophagia bacterium]
MVNISKILVFLFSLLAFKASYAQSRYVVATQSTAPASMQSIPLDFSRIQSGFQSNNIRSIAHYFDEFVPITLNNEQSIYSSNQAIAILSNFFQKNQPITFDPPEQGATSANSYYLVQNFTAKTGRYNLYIAIRCKDNTNCKIKDLSISRE